MYWPMLFALYRQRWASLGYTHAYFILPLSIWFAYRRKSGIKKAIEQETKKYSPLSLLWVFSGAFLYILSWRQGYMLLAAFSLLPFLYGTVGFIYGRQTQKILRIPIIYLLFMVPPPFALLDKITLPLRYISAASVESILKILGFKVIREGLNYTVNGHSMTVEEACSGFRSLITMLALGFAYIIAYKGNLKRNTMLILSVAPLALIGNIIRILIISFMAVFLGEKTAEGFMHSFSGIVVFIFVVIGFLAIENILNKKETKEFEWFA